MVQAKRIEGKPVEDPRHADLRQAAAYEPGGDVGALQQELARRLFSPAEWPTPMAEPSAEERLIRTVSVGAGYAALVVGIVIVATVLQ
jgi:hypothetical protein